MVVMSDKMHVVMKVPIMGDEIIYEKPVGVYPEEEIDEAREASNKIIDDGYGSVVREVPVGEIDD